MIEEGWRLIEEGWGVYGSRLARATCVPNTPQSITRTGRLSREGKAVSHTLEVLLQLTVTSELPLLW